MKVTAGGVTAGLFALLVAGVCVRLGIWQLDRLEQRRATNAAVEAALSLPPLRLDGPSVARLAREPGSVANRRARVVGTYDPQGEVVLRGRARDGQPGVHLVTPLEIAGSDYSILVDRGWVPSPDAFTVDPRPLAEPGEVVVEGLLLPYPRVDEGARPAPLRVDGAEILTVQRLDHALVQGRSARPLLPVYLQQLPDSAARATPPLRTPAPELGEGNHLSYAVQWFSFAAIAVVGFLVVALRKSRPPR